MKAHDKWQFAWLLSSLLSICGEVEPDAQVTGIAVSVLTAEGTTVHYTMAPGMLGVQRTLVTPEALAISRDFAGATVDITPEIAP